MSYAELHKSVRHKSMCLEKRVVDVDRTRPKKQVDQETAYRLDNPSTKFAVEYDRNNIDRFKCPSFQVSTA